MKKKCISTNKAKSIDESVECFQEAPCVTSTSCINPIQYILEKALENAILSNVPFDEAFNLLLINGTVLTQGNVNNSGFCCPSANNCGINGSGDLSSVYLLSNMDTFSTTAVFLGWGETNNTPLPVSSLRPCCINLYGDIQINSQYLALMQTANPTSSEDRVLAPECCLTPNRITCLNNLEMYVGTIEGLLNLGLIEVGGFLNSTTSELESQICIITAFIETVENSHYFETTSSVWIKNLLASGLAVFCCGCQIFIGDGHGLVTFVGTTNSENFRFPNGCNIIIEGS